MTQGFALQADNLTIGWNGVPLADSLSFDLAPGRTLAIIGESGCGKSTLLATLAGLKPAMAGSVSWKSATENRAPRRAMVWQSLALFPWKKVDENLALPLELAHESNIPDRVAAMLSELELEGLEKRYPHELSGGQRQRLALGRALIGRPDVLFMDEPFSAIDAILREHLQNFLKRLWLHYGCSVVFVTHDISEAIYLGEDIALMGARPSRLVACAANPAFTESADSDVRDSELFYAMQRRLHESFRAARKGEAVAVEGGKWL